MSSITAFAGSVPANYDRYLGPALFEPFATDLTERIKKLQVNNMLEIACGTGRVTKHLIAMLPEKGRLIASDLNPDMIGLAKSRIKDERIQWQQANAQELPFPPDQFDVVVCQFGVMFFPDKVSAFKEVYRVLHAGGRFIFNTWDELKYNLATLYVKKALDNVLKEEAPDFLTKGPFSFYNADEIKNFLKEAGFRNINIDKVQKYSVFNDPDDLIYGYLDGTPLHLMTKTFDPSTRRQVEDEIRKELKKAGANEQGYPMQALVCSAEK